MKYIMIRKRKNKIIYAVRIRKNNKLLYYKEFNNIENAEKDRNIQIKILIDYNKNIKKNTIINISKILKNKNINKENIKLLLSNDFKKTEIASYFNVKYDVIRDILRNKNRIINNFTINKNLDYKKIINEINKKSKYDYKLQDYIYNFFYNKQLFFKSTNHALTAINTYCSKYTFYKNKNFNQAPDVIR